MNDEKKTFIIRLNLKLKLFLLVFVITICVLIGMIVLSMKQENVVINKYESDYINFTLYGLYLQVYLNFLHTFLGKMDSIARHNSFAVMSSFGTHEANLHSRIANLLLRLSRQTGTVRL